MKKVWNFINKLKVKKATKNSLFIWGNAVFYALVGAVVWAVFGRLLLPGLEWLFCFIGYPAIILGILCSALYLYNNEFA